MIMSYTQYHKSVIHLHGLGKNTDKMASQDFFYDYIP